MKDECPLPIKEIDNEINQERGAGFDKALLLTFVVPFRVMIIGLRL
jgi:hypothetical protein